MKCGIVVFPGSNCDHDVYHVLSHVLEQETAFLWHQETSLEGCELVVLPGGFSYGDYLRAGSMAAHSPIMAAVRRHAEAGGRVLGICNGFQMLLETGLLPGAMRRNRYVDAAGRLEPAANLNGSERAIAGICNAGGNVLGLMPHPERCAEEMLGNRDGLGLLAGAVAAGGGRVGSLAAAGG